MSKDALIRIGQLAKRLDLNPKTIRYYEDVALLPEPERSSSGYRLFGPEHEERLRFIRSAQRVGLTLGEIKEILELRDQGKAPCDYVTETVERRLAQVDQKIADLEELKRELQQISKRARSLPQKSPDPNCYCHILQAPKPA